MFNKGEFELVCEVFRKRGISVTVFDRKGSTEGIPEEFLISGVFDKINIITDETSSDRHGENILYRFRDGLGFRGLLFSLGRGRGQITVLIGPYFDEERSESHLMEALEKEGVDPKLHAVLTKHLVSIPNVSEGSSLMLMLNSFLERAYKQAGYSALDIELDGDKNLFGVDTAGEGGDLESSALHMKLIEKRYAFENELMMSVSAGHLQKVNSLIASLGESRFEMRTSDPLRNLKNYCIIMNTLLRKSAEQGGVHPVFIDKMSTDFAIRIEKLTGAKSCSALMKEMYESYCKMVRKHTVKDYSAVVKKTVSLIAYDLSADLSPGRLAEMVGVSLPYLSTLFKKETGSTLGEYIRERRMKYAARLLKDATLQVQSVALAVGIQDVQYFSKMFKAYSGFSPIEYRRKESDKPTIEQ